MEDLAKIKQSVGNLKILAGAQALAFLILCVGWKADPGIVEARQFVLVDAKGSPVGSWWYAPNVGTYLHIGPDQASDSIDIHAGNGLATILEASGEHKAMLSTGGGSELQLGSPRKGDSATLSAKRGVEVRRDAKVTWHAP